MKNDYPILALCANLDVSPSGDYAWHQRRTSPGPRAVANQALALEIQHSHTQSRQTYGRPRLVAALRQQGRRHGRNRVARLMKAAGLCGRQKGRFRVQTTDSQHDQPIAPNQPPRPPPPTSSGWPTSPISKLRKAGFISPPASTFTAARSSAGP